MANVIYYPVESDFRLFVSILQNGNFHIKKYLPSIDEDWFKLICDCVNYVRDTSIYEENLSIHEVTARLLYKVSKRHELGDGAINEVL